LLGKRADYFSRSEIRLVRRLESFLPEAGLVRNVSSARSCLSWSGATGGSDKPWKGGKSVDRFPGRAEGPCRCHSTAEEAADTYLCLRVCYQFDLIEMASAHVCSQGKCHNRKYFPVGSSIQFAPRKNTPVTKPFFCHFFLMPKSMPSSHRARRPPMAAIQLNPKVCC
jgi:hypothetical protein